MRILAASILALLVALFMQTGLCPHCLMSDCASITSDAGIDRNDSNSSCCSQNSDTPTYDYFLSETVSDQLCDTCGTECSGQCYIVELEYIVPLQVADSIPAAKPSVLPEIKETSTDAILAITLPQRQSQIEDLPPPDTVFILKATELLL